MSKSPQELVLVTGASGYIAAHVVSALLEAGYRVRGTARGAKLETLRDFWKSNPNFEAVQIDDIATGNFSVALKGVNAVLHVASPPPGKESPEGALRSAVEGTLNVLRQAVNAGVSKFVVTSSGVTALDPSLADSYTGITFTENSYGQVTREDILSGKGSDQYVYGGTKIFAERAAWEFAEAHPEIDLATINPPLVFGPPILPVTGGPSSLGTNGLIYSLITSNGGGIPLFGHLPPLHVHVRAVALAHVRALQLPKLPNGANVRERRFLVASPEIFTWVDATKYLSEKRPELKGRLPSLENASPLPGPVSRIDATRAKEVLGIKEYVSWQETLEETIDSLLEAEKAWK